MTILFAFIGNRPDLGGKLISVPPAPIVHDRAPDQAWGWGLGCFQGDEILLQRRPNDDRARIDLTAEVKSRRTHALLGSILPSGPGARTEDTPPFRHRSWLFASAGSIGGFERLRPRLFDALPPFLRNNVRGQTAGELAFFTFLSFLHDASALKAGTVDPALIRNALRTSMSLMDRLSSEEGFPANDGDYFVTNGDALVVAHRTGRLAMRSFRSRTELETVLPPESIAAPSVDASRFTLVCSGVDPVPVGWEQLPEQTMLTASATSPAEVESL